MKKNLLSSVITLIIVLVVTIGTLPLSSQQSIPGSSCNLGACEVDLGGDDRCTTTLYYCENETAWFEITLCWFTYGGEPGTGGPYQGQPCSM